ARGIAGRMPLKLGPITLPWPGRRSADPYWDIFINTPPADLENSVVEMIRRAPEGNVFPAKEDLHTPEITSSHVKELGLYLGGDMIGITHGNDEYPFAVITVTKADYDPYEVKGMGGQVPVQNALYVTFVLGAWIRELGYQATSRQESREETE